MSRLCSAPTLHDSRPDAALMHQTHPFVDTNHFNNKRMSECVNKTEALSSAPASVTVVTAQHYGEHPLLAPARAISCVRIRHADELGKKKKFYATAEKVERGHQLVRDFLLRLNTSVVRIQSSDDGDRALNDTHSLLVSCVRSLARSPTHSLTHSLTFSLAPPLTRKRIWTSVRSYWPSECVSRWGGVVDRRRTESDLFTE